MIKIDKLIYSYGEAALALNEISVEFTPNHISAIIGESGSGKTTLLRCIGRFLDWQSGSLLLDGVDISEIPELEFRRRIGIVFQRLHLFPHLTVRQNMTIPLEHVVGKDISTSLAEADEMLGRLAIGDLVDSYPSQISGGQAQRAAIARSLLLKPQYLLLDEPTSALDANTTDDFAEWLLELQPTTNFIIVTHDMQFAAKVATHGVYLSDGQVKDSGEIQEIMKHLAVAPKASPN